MRLLRPIAALILAGALHAQIATEANSGYRTPEGRKTVAATLSDPHRDERQKPKELVDAMGISPGMTVADIGTGIGYMLPFLSRAVGPKGRVLGEDIFDDFLAAAKQRVEDQHLQNVTLIKGSDKSPNLPENQLDRILILDVYHHFDYPAEMLAVIHKALKSGGKLFIVDYDKTPEAMPNGRAMTHIRLKKDEAIKEISQHHFKLASQREHIPNSQYMLVFEKN